MCKTASKPSTAGGEIAQEVFIVQNHVAVVDCGGEIAQETFVVQNHVAVVDCGSKIAQETFVVRNRVAVVECDCRGYAEAKLFSARLVVNKNACRKSSDRHSFLSGLFLRNKEDIHQRAYEQQHGVGEIGDYVERGNGRSQRRCRGNCHKSDRSHVVL